MNEQLLKEITEILTKQKEKLEKDLLQFTKQSKTDTSDYLTSFPDYGDKEDENAVEVATYDTNIKLEDTLEKLLRDVNKSLERIEKGTYGICKYCGKEIQEARLKARPTSSACVACKKTLTQEE